MARRDFATAERELSAAVEVFRTYPAPLVEWKTYATLGRLYRLTERPEAARQAFARSVEIVKTVAAKIDDEPLRSTFLGAPAVQEVLHSHEEQCEAPKSDRPDL